MPACIVTDETNEILELCRQALRTVENNPRIEVVVMTADDLRLIEAEVTRLADQAVELKWENEQALHECRALHQQNDYLEEQLFLATEFA